MREEQLQRGSYSILEHVNIMQMVLFMLISQDILISVSSPVTTISLNPLLPYHLAVGASDSAVRIFDRRMLSPSSSHGGQVKERSLEALLARFTVPEFSGRNKRITSVQYRPDGREVLASYSSDYIYIFDPTVRCFSYRVSGFISSA